MVLNNNKMSGTCNIEKVFWKTYGEGQYDWQEQRGTISMVEKEGKEEKVVNMKQGDCKKDKSEKNQLA